MTSHMQPRNDQQFDMESMLSFENKNKGLLAKSTTALNGILGESESHKYLFHKHLWTKSLNARPT